MNASTILHFFILNVSFHLPYDFIGKQGPAISCNLSPLCIFWMVWDPQAQGSFLFIWNFGRVGVCLWEPLGRGHCCRRRLARSCSCTQKVTLVKGESAFIRPAFCCKCSLYLFCGRARTWERGQPDTHPCPCIPSSSGQSVSVMVPGSSLLTFWPSHTPHIWGGGGSPLTWESLPLRTLSLVTVG